MTRDIAKPTLPRGTEDNRGDRLATSVWMKPHDVERLADGRAFTYCKGKIWIGRTPTEGQMPVGWIDGRHIVTVAGSRAGKGVSAIIPALCEYPGSVI